MWFLALCAFAWPLREGLFHGDRLLCAVDTATAQLPWCAAPGGSPAVANPELADQGMVFYPAYRFALREWSLGGPPLWNPLIYAGAPAVGNPQLGLLDPQVLLQVVLGRALGEGAFDWSFALLLWLRLAAAAAGAYALARRVSLGRRGAALAAVGFSTAGFTILWANHSLGHVTPFLPWVLYALEGLRAHHGARRARSFAAAALLFAAAILGGHPETAFNLGLAAGLWALALARESWRAAFTALGALALGTLLAAPSLLPFVEYLTHSGALVARRLAAPDREPDWIAAGLFLLAAGAVWRWRELTSTGAPGVHRGGGFAALGLGGIVAGAVVIAFGGLGGAAPRLLLWPAAFGLPHDTAATGGYWGGGQFLEQASAWVAAPILLLSLGACFAAGGPGAMRRRGTCLALALGGLCLSLDAPGLGELYGALPLVGLAAGARAALVSALCLSLVAGEFLERAPRAASFAALGSLLVLAPCALYRGAPEPVSLPAEFSRAADPNDGVVGFLERPAPELDGAAALSGWIDPGLAVGAAELRVESFSAQGARQESVPVELTRAAPTIPEGPALGSNGAPAPPGALYFRASRLWLEHLDEGVVRFTLRLSAADGRLLGERVAAVSTLSREPVLDPTTLILWVLALLFLLGLPAPAAAWALVVFAALQAFLLHDGVHSAVPRARAFPETATERILARELGSRRTFAEPGVLPANTGMVRALRAVDGYDGLDPASFDGYRAAVLRPGVQPLIGFSARNARLASAPFRLLGVGALVLRGPLEAPGFELVASPEPGAPEHAECWIYRALDPLPRAFCVPRTISREAALADLERFDPLAAAFLEDGARVELARPFSRAEVRELEFENDAVRMTVDLDGDGLLLLTEQHFPGWRATVNGEERPVLRADSIFRALSLGAGVHRIEFRYAPASWRAGLWLCLAAACVLLFVARRLGRPGIPHP